MVFYLDVLYDLLNFQENESKEYTVTFTSYQNKGHHPHRRVKLLLFILQIIILFGYYLLLKLYFKYLKPLAPLEACFKQNSMKVLILYKWVLLSHDIKLQEAKRDLRRKFCKTQNDPQPWKPGAYPENSSIVPLPPIQYNSLFEETVKLFTDPLEIKFYDMLELQRQDEWFLRERTGEFKPLVENNLVEVDDNDTSEEMDAVESKDSKTQFNVRNHLDMMFIECKKKIFESSSKNDEKTQENLHQPKFLRKKLVKLTTINENAIGNQPKTIKASNQQRDRNNSKKPTANLDRNNSPNSSEIKSTRQDSPKTTKLNTEDRGIFVNRKK